MGNCERSGYRDLIANQWHRLIPGVREIDLDIAQVCKHAGCNNLSLIVETTRQSHVKPTSILRRLGSVLGIQSILLNFYTRPASDAFDKRHRQYLQRYYELESKIRTLSEQKVHLVNEMYRYCIELFGEDAYAAIIKFAGIEIVAPDHKNYSTYDDMAAIARSFQRYRFCAEHRNDDGLTVNEPNILNPEDFIKVSVEDVEKAGQLTFPILDEDD